MKLTIVRFVGNLLVVSTMTLHGCALDGDKQRAMTQDSPTNESKGLQSATPPGYPYPPEDLWRRLADVIKTPPDELSHRKLGQIFGLEFDEDKMLWYGDKALRKYFLLTKDSIRNAEAFPFKRFNLTQGEPDPTIEVKRRHIAFHFAPFDQKYLGTSEIYCIKPLFADIETLGYRHDKVASNRPQRPNSDGNMPWFPYRTEIFVNDVDRKSIGFEQINLQVYPNGCLVGISYFNYPAY
jgi:hypothetical protein